MRSIPMQALNFWRFVRGQVREYPHLAPMGRYLLNYTAAQLRETGRVRYEPFIAILERQAGRWNHA
jgi:hypothetical protein